MSIYYYFIPSLPMLFFHHGQPPISHSSFLEDCARLLEKSEYEQIYEARLCPTQSRHTKNSTFKKWLHASCAIRNEMVKIRAKRLNVDQNQYLKREFSDPIYTKQVEEAIDEFTPLRVEHHLMELQWTILDDLQSGHQFDIDFLIVYSIKLELLERKASFNYEIGKKIFEDIIFGRSKLD